MAGSSGWWLVVGGGCEKVDVRWWEVKVSVRKWRGGSYIDDLEGAMTQIANEEMTQAANRRASK